MKKRQIDSYNALRGICAIGILFSHMSYLAASDNSFWSGIYNYFMRYGARCTSFFFILSGFLAAYTWKDISFGKYIKGKLKRIYPLTFCVFLLAIACSFIMNDTVNSDMAVGSPLWILSIILNPLLLKAFVPIEGVFYSFHGPSWYVSVLFVFYIVAYFLIKKLNKTDAKKKNIILAVIVGAAYAIQFAVCLITDICGLEDQRLYLTYVNPYFRIFGECMLGVLLQNIIPYIYIYIRNIQRKLRFLTQSFLEVFAIILFIADFILNNFVESSLYSAWLQIIPMSLLIVCFYNDDGIVSRFFKRKPWQFIGNISFELYMTHAFVYEGLPVALGFVSGTLKSWIVYHAGTRFIITFILCLIFAWIVHIIFSRKKRKAKL